MKKRVKKEKLIYKVIPKLEEKSLFCVELVAGSGFPGVVIEYTQFVTVDDKPSRLTDEQKELRKQLKADLKEDPDAGNAKMEYRVVKVPKGKFQNMADSKKKVFETTVQKIFLQVLETALKLMEEEKLAKE